MRLQESCGITISYYMDKQLLYFYIFYLSLLFKNDALSRINVEWVGWDCCAI